MGRNISCAKKAKRLSEENFLLAEKLYSENSYYDWSIVVLFYSSCALINSICELEGIAVPERHKGRWNKESGIYIKGMLDIANEYLEKIPYENYSFLLIQSQMLRYKPSTILEFKKNVDTPKLVGDIFEMFKVILKDFENKYDKYL
jgi:hypothetical protein